MGHLIPTRAGAKSFMARIGHLRGNAGMLLRLSRPPPRPEDSVNAHNPPAPTDAGDQTQTAATRPDADPRSTAEPLDATLPPDRVPDDPPDADEWEEGDAEPGDEQGSETAATPAGETKGAGTRRRRRQPKLDSLELRLRGRRALCKRIEDIAPHMLKMVKLRILTNYLPTVKGMEDDDLTRALREDATKLADRARVLAAVNTPDPDFNRGQLKAIILAVLLQEETHSLPEYRTDEKVIEFEKAIVKRAKALDLTELRKDDPDRWHHFDTYRIVLEAAWSNDGTISPDEARLLGVLRSHLNISREEHWLISALLKRFPKEKCDLHTPGEVDEARKELQRAGVVWSYRDEDDRHTDVIPTEVAALLRREYAGQELQVVNFCRLLSHDGVLTADLREALERRGLDRSGNKAELVHRVASSEVKPSEVLSGMDKERLSAICGSFGLKSSGSKAELVTRLIEFYDDLTFEERVSKDEREKWYADYELLAARSYAELRAKKVITRDLEIQTLFEDATEFLFEVRLRVPTDRARKENRADGRLCLDQGVCLFWDCKSAEAAVNLQDYLDDQFDGYLRKEREAGGQPLGFLVIGPAFTPQSLILANKYKARTGWDVALVTAVGLKHLAERWAAQTPDKPFPVRLLSRTEVIDKERAEFLLSLA
jgi:hypothetical protein